MLEGQKIIVVGAGFSGAVMAERIASVLGEKVLLIDKRSTLGGNSWSEVDPASGIECHRYGSHIFHTSNREVWNYIQQFTEFTNYRHKVLSRCRGKIYFMPMNLKTLNDFYGRDLSPKAAAALLAEEIANSGVSIPRNLEEKAISLIGRPLYETFIAGYTGKQWGRNPKELPPDIITRLPVRMTFNTDYFNDPWQGVPKEGYFTLFSRLLRHPNIEIRLNTDFKSIRKLIPAKCKIIYTGMIDEYFDHCFGTLEWRSLRFEWETLPMSDYQGTTVINYGDTEVPYTRIHEFKHFHPERQTIYELGQTVICREYSQEYKSGQEAYYPINDLRNSELYAKYEQLAEHNQNVIFCGRLACYRYWDMDKAIEAALKCFKKNFVSHNQDN